MRLEPPRDSYNSKEMLGCVALGSECHHAKRYLYRQRHKRREVPGGREVLSGDLELNFA